jgi:hypothetical protein
MVDFADSRLYYVHSGRTLSGLYFSTCCTIGFQWSKRGDPKLMRSLLVVRLRRVLAKVPQPDSVRVKIQIIHNYYTLGIFRSLEESSCAFVRSSNCYFGFLVVEARGRQFLCLRLFTHDNEPTYCVKQIHSSNPKPLFSLRGMCCYF